LFTSPVIVPAPLSVPPLSWIAAPALRLPPLSVVAPDDCV
jgi:hypothetical protein